MSLGQPSSVAAAIARLASGRWTRLNTTTTATFLRPIVPYNAIGGAAGSHRWSRPLSTLISASQPLQAVRK